MTGFEFPSLYGAGLLTFASPCVLPLIPMYLATLSGAAVSGLQTQRRSRLLWSAVGFSLGLTLVFVGLGMAATMLGRSLLQHREVLLQIAGVLVVLFGLKFLGIVRIPALESEVRPLLGRLGGRGFFGGVLLGAGFALGWSPCIGPVLGSVLTFAATQASSPTQGMAFLAVYAAGVSTPLLMLALLASRLTPLLGKLKRRMPLFEKLTGAAMLVVGALLFTNSLSLLSPSVDAVGEGEASHADVAVCDGTSPCELPEAGLDDSTSAPEPVFQGPVMIEFLSKDCPVCQRMTPVVAAAEKLCAHEGTATKRIYVDKAAGRRAASAAGVRGVPTFVFLDSRGTEVARLIGEQSLEALVRAREATVGANCAKLGSSVETQSPPI